METWLLLTTLTWLTNLKISGRTRLGKFQGWMIGAVSPIQKGGGAREQRNS
jgi:hypothetical protein